jgi:hypothetical protein
LQADVNRPIQGKKHTPLHLAKTTKVAKVLRNRGQCDIDPVDIFKYTPLFHHARLNNYEIVKYLISQGANIDHIDLRQCNILHAVAYSHASPEMISLLLKNGADYLYSRQGCLPIQIMNEASAVGFKEYGFIVFPNAIFELLCNNCAILRSCLLRAEGEDQEKEYLQELQLIFEEFIKIYKITNADLSEEHIKKQMIKRSHVLLFGVTCRYPSYELLCKFFGKKAVDFIKVLLSSQQDL